MVDARIQILTLLKNIEYTGLTVKPNFPKEIKPVPLVTFFEVTNSNTSIKVRDSISYQIDVFENNFERVIDLMQLVDGVMTQLGLNRNYVSPDEDCIDASGYYRKTLRYSCNVDIRTGRIID